MMTNFSTINSRLDQVLFNQSTKSYTNWNNKVDPLIMRSVPTINKYIIDTATRISDETGEKVYPKDIIDAVLKSIDPDHESSSNFNNMDSPVYRSPDYWKSHIGDKAYLEATSFKTYWYVKDVDSDNEKVKFIDPIDKKEFWVSMNECVPVQFKK